jgi:hypothetical protein
MHQILHIFKKDVRRHWPEILISFALLGMYVRIMTHHPDDRLTPYSFPWYQLSASSVPTLLIIFWIFLTIRLVQGEALVGDRQWWVTKPYEWWKLLAAKEIFLLAFIGVPLFLVQLYLLHHAGFPILPHFFGVLTMQLALATVLFLPAVTLGSLTKSVGQALIALLIVFVGISATVSLLSKVPNSSMSSAVEGLGNISSILVLGSIIGAAGWQYARRRTWASRGLLVAGVGVVVLITALTPYAMFVNRKYPLLESKDAPAQISSGVLPKSTKKPPVWFDRVDEIPLTIPINVSGVGTGKVVFIQGIRLTLETPGGAKWEPGWKQERTPLWPEDSQNQISFQIDRKKFDQIKAKTGTLHMEFALTEYQAEESRNIVLSEGEFSDPPLGLCAFSLRSPSQIDCRRPFRIPGLIATFDPSQASCQLPEDDTAISEDRISHAWYPPSDNDSPGPGLNPVVTYPLAFGSGQLVFTPDKRPKRKTVYLCPGANVKLAKPQAVRDGRVKIEMNNVALQDLVNFGNYEN